MKKTLFLLLAIIPILAFPQKTIIIDNPQYEVKTSGIRNISRIELSDADTRVYLKQSFIHNWWINIPRETFIVAEGSEQKLIATGIEKGEFDKKIFMPESNDSTFILIFPPLDKSVRKINYGEKDKTVIFGISLEKGINKSNDKNTIPSDIRQWLNAELDKVKGIKPTEYDSDNFFKKDGVARLVGYIKGYDCRLGFNTAIMYSSNELTREDFPITIEIQPDGRFETDIPMLYPEHTYISINNKNLDLYLEPGNTLSIIIDWEDFLYADRWRNTQHNFNKTEFEGPLAKINKDLKSVTLANYNYSNYKKDIKNHSPEHFFDKALELYKKNKDIISKLPREAFSTQSIQILENKAILRSAYLLMDYPGTRKSYFKDSLPAPLPENYYDMLSLVPLNDQSLLTVSEFSGFINRLEYCEPFLKTHNLLHKREPLAKSFFQYLTEEKGIILTDNEINLRSRVEKILINFVITGEQMKIYEDNKDSITALYKKYDKHFKTYNEKYYPKQEALSPSSMYKKEWLIKDSILVKDLNLKLHPNLVHEIIKTRALDLKLKNSSKENALEILDIFNEQITHPILKEEGARLFSKTFPEKVSDSYKLPEGKATDIFKQIADKFKGKYILVDFWDCYCGSCIMGIKNSKKLREKYKDDENIAFIFITSTTGSPLDRYNKLVEENDMIHTFRLSDDDFNRMRQLFKFNGIPHYRTIDRNGDVLLDTLYYHNFEYQYPQLLKEESNNKL